MLKNSQNPATAQRVAVALVDPATDTSLAKVAGVPSAERALLAGVPTDAIADAMNRSAIIGRGWFDPSDSATRQIFSDMVQSVIIGRSTTVEAVSLAQSQMNQLFSTPQ